MTSKAAVTPLSKEQLSRSTVKVAAVQMTGNWNWHADKFKPDSGEKVLEYIDRAAADGADLVVFPELLLGMFKVPSPTTEKISAAAAKHNIYVIAGCFEILEEGGYTNSSLVFDRQGKIIGRYFKMHPAVGGAPFLWPPIADDPEWTMKDGQDFPVFDLDFGRIGILTCYDGLFPEPFRVLSLKGAEILIWPNARGGAVEDYIVKTAMVQNHVHMICTNKAIGAGTMIAEWPGRIDQITTDPGEQYIVDTLDLSNLRQGRKYSRQFFQRFPEKYTEILNDYKVSNYYVNMPDAPELPAPSQLAEIRHTKGSRGIQIEPVINDTMIKRRAGLTEGLDLYRLAFRMSAPWMEGSVELRLPEILYSDLGYHFLDHYLSTLAPLSELDPFPQWRREPMTGALYYDCQTQEGIAFGAKATPKYDEVELEFYITNKTGKTLDAVSHNPCLDLKGSPQFDNKFNLKNLFAVYDGQFQDLTGTTPTPEQVGRDPWLILLTSSGQETFDGPKDSKSTWWRIDQVADENLMAAQSKDGKYLIGYTWDREDENLMTNGGNPCLHTGPGAILDLENDQTAKWCGKIYFLENDPDQLLKRYRDDQGEWQQDRK
jgi:predicted amidohydrolase